VLKRAGWRRSDLVISTKLFLGAGDPTTPACRANTSWKACTARWSAWTSTTSTSCIATPDPDTPLAETVRAMSDVVSAAWRSTGAPASGALMRSALPSRSRRAPTSYRHDGAAAVQPVAAGESRRRILALFADFGLAPRSGPVGERHPHRQVRRRHSAREPLRQSPVRLVAPHSRGRAGRWKLEVSRRLAPIAAELGCTRAQLAIACV